MEGIPNILEHARRLLLDRLTQAWKSGGLIKGLTQHQAHTDEDEFLRLTKIPLDEAVARCMRGEMTDSKTIVGLLMAQKVLSADALDHRLDVASIQRKSSALSSCCADK